MYMYAGFYNKVATKANGNEAFNNVRTLKFVVYSISMKRNEMKASNTEKKWDKKNKIYGSIP